MVRNKLINLISNTLSIDETFIFEDANLRLLCIMSNYLDGLDNVDKQKVIINREGLKNNTLQNIKYKDRKLLIDINFLFKNNDNESIIYNDYMGRDGFYNFQMLEVLLILEIESKFDIQIHDDQASDFKTIGQVISHIKNAK